MSLSPADERRNWHAIGQEFVGFRVLDRPCRRQEFAESICLSPCAPGSGRERHSEHGGRAFYGRGPRPVNAPSEAQPKASRVLCGTGLDRSWLAPVTSSGFGMARFLSPRTLLLTRCRFVWEWFSDSLRDCRTAFTVTKTAHCRGRIPSRKLFGVCRKSSGSGLSPPPHPRRTKPKRTPDSSTRDGTGSDSASTRNPRWINMFTRRELCSAQREPISSRRPATALFSVVTNELPKVYIQLPFGDDVS